MYLIPLKLTFYLILYTFVNWELRVDRCHYFPTTGLMAAHRLCVVVQSLCIAINNVKATETSASWKLSLGNQASISYRLNFNIFCSSFFFLFYVVSFSFDFFSSFFSSINNRAWCASQFFHYKDRTIDK